jgi:membrane associated rhomboid family serine protease
MGFYDRDYYRQGSGLSEVFARTGQVCKGLLLANILVFFFQALDRQAGGLTDWFLLDTQRVFRGEVWRLISYAFLHVDLLHLLFNMLFLWWFGSELEERYGRWEFLAFYLLAALAGGLAFQAYGAAVSYQESGTLTAESLRCVGASGAVTAVLVLAACHFPNRVIYIFFVLPAPLWLFVLLIVLVDALYFMKGESTGTAVVVHLAGAGLGLVYYLRGWRLLALGEWLASWRRPRPRLRLYRGEDAAPAAPVPPRTAEEIELEAQLDAVLEKLSRSGRASLTESERALLLRASEIYRKRRS